MVKERCKCDPATVQADIELLRTILEDSSDLLTPAWRRRNAAGHPLTGHCYVAAEALWHLLGGRASCWRPHVLSFRDGGGWQPAGGAPALTHWWLQDEDGRVLDPTAAQFTSVVPYERGRPQAFLTNRRLAGRPSRRARTLLTRYAGALRVTSAAV